MKALTLYQPWASLIAIGAKRIETRSWGTSYRGPLAIHAAKKYPTEAQDFHKEMHRRYGLLAAPLPLGAIVATTTLVQCYRISYMDERAIAAGTTVSVSPDRRWGQITPAEAQLGDYAACRWAWILIDLVRLDPVVPMPGARGLWEWGA